MSEYLEVRYLTDDRDYNERSEVVITLAPNGDFYIGVAPEGMHPPSSVRICQSGGASTINPRFSRAVQDMFWALQEPDRPRMFGDG